MRRTVIALGLIAAAALVVVSGGPREQTTAQAALAEGNSPMLVHSVYFSLKDNSPEAVRKLLDSCQKNLTGHPGVTYFACGTPCDLDRPVNDRDFDVSLLVVFEDRAAHDKYQPSEKHLQFIAENRENFAKVRVFDSDCEGAK